MAFPRPRRPLLVAPSLALGGSHWYSELRVTSPSGRVVVVGGGISDLATARALARLVTADTVEIEVRERDNRLGGSSRRRRSPAARPRSTREPAFLAGPVRHRARPYGRARRRAHVTGVGDRRRALGRPPPPIPSGLMLGVPAGRARPGGGQAVLLAGQAARGRRWSR